MRLGTALGASAAVALGGLAYGAGYERTAYTLRRASVPVLAPDADPLRVLHLSDLHMLPSEHGKQQWLRELARLVPDLVVLTGDVWSSPKARPAVLRALEPLFATPGLFVPGNNDYYVPQLKSPHRYLTGSQSRRRKLPMDWDAMAADLVRCGWTDATHRNLELKVAGRRVYVRGVDDPYLRRDRLELVSGPAPADADLRLGVAHAPEPRVLDSFVGDGMDLLLAGHTHGGQLRIPGFGPIVTNCGIDRPRARGLARYGARGRVGWLHVSAGLGTSPYAPVRFACRPEATLLTLRPVGRGGVG